MDSHSSGVGLHLTDGPDAPCLSDHLGPSPLLRVLLVGLGGGHRNFSISQMNPGHWELVCSLVSGVGFDPDIHISQKLRIFKCFLNELMFSRSLPKVV